MREWLWRSEVPIWAVAVLWSLFCGSLSYVVNHWLS